MARVELTNLLNQVEEEIGPFDFQEIIYQVRENPRKYKLTKLEERKDQKQIGPDDIFRKGKIIAYADNERFDLQKPEFKSRFPELATKIPSAIVERVEDVYLLNKETGQVEVIVGKYLIQER